MSNWNKSYFEISGTFTGAGDSDYEIYINNLDTLVWRYKVNGVWSSTSVHNLTGAGYSPQASTITHTASGASNPTLVTGMPFTGAAIPVGARVGVVTDTTHFEMTDADGIAIVPTGTKSGQTLEVTPGHYTTANWAVATTIPLGGTGVKVKFTRPTKSYYNTGDKWSWTQYAVLQLNPSTDSGYNTLEIIERSDKKDLIAISDTTGKVALIEDFENTPTVTQTNLGLGALPAIDTCHRNKEIYVAAGRTKSPRFIGYTKNLGFDGLGDTFALIEDKAYEQIDSESFDAKAMNDFVFLRGDASTQGAGNIVVGIIYGESKLYIWNKDDSKVYIFTLGQPAIRIRPDASVSTGTGTSNVINGVAVMTESQQEGYCNTIECWSIPFSGAGVGQGANLDRRVNIKAPTNNTNVSLFTDFLIVSTNFDRETVGNKYHIIFASQMSGIEEINNTCLFKSLNFDEIDSITTYDNISPGLDYTSENAYGGHRFVSRRVKQNFEWEGYEQEEDGVPEVSAERKNTTRQFVTATNGSLAHISAIQDISLDFSGYSSNGENPMFHFTAKIAAHTDYEETGDLSEWYDDADIVENDYDLSVNWWQGPFWQDSAGKILAVSWTTFQISALATSVTKGPKLFHFMDWVNDSMFQTHYEMDSGGGAAQHFTWFLDAFSERLVDNIDFPPNNRPNFCKDAGSGMKHNFIGDIDTNGLRYGFITPRPYAVGGVYSRIYTFNTPYSTGGDELWDAEGGWIYPNISGTMYTRANAINGEWASVSQPPFVISRLECSDSEDSKRWQLGDTDYGMTISSGYPSSTHRQLVMQGPDEGQTSGNTPRISEVQMHATNNTTLTNLLGNSGGWVTFGNVTQHTVDAWEGGATKKSFYRMAIVYDGYQESTLLSVTKSFSQTADFEYALKFTITIDGAWIPPDRVASIVIYRADDPIELSVSPAGLYRFIEEIPLVSFSQDSSANFTYTVYDTGTSAGSYGAINGIAETLSNLHMKYSVCASVNGYMFIGNCEHSKFDSAENFIFRSQAGKFSIFDWSKDFTPVDFIPKAIAGFMGKLYVFGSNKTAIINPETLIVEDEINGVGCVGPKAIQNTPSGLYWFDQNNIYMASPQIRKIGTPILKQETKGWAVLSDNVKASAVSGYDSNRHCYLIYFKDGSDNRVWSYYIATSRWDLWETDFRVYDTVQGSDGHCILLMENGRISKHLGGSNKRDWEFQSKKLSFGQGTVRKKFKSIKVDSTSKSKTGLSYKTNDNNSSWQTGTDISSRYFGTSTGGNALKVASSDSTLRWIQVKITGDNDQSNSNVLAKSLGLVYKPKSPR